MSPPIDVRCYCVNGFPRVSGDEPRMVDELEAMAMFSPRERG